MRGAAQKVKTGIRASPERIERIISIGLFQLFQLFQLFFSLMEQIVILMFFRGVVSY